MTERNNESKLNSPEAVIPLGVLFDFLSRLRKSDEEQRLALQATLDGGIVSPDSIVEVDDGQKVTLLEAISIRKGRRMTIDDISAFLIAQSADQAGHLTWEWLAQEPSIFEDPESGTN